MKQAKTNMIKGHHARNEQEQLFAWLVDNAFVALPGRCATLDDESLSVFATLVVEETAAREGGEVREHLARLLKAVEEVEDGLCSDAEDWGIIGGRVLRLDGIGEDAVRERMRATDDPSPALVAARWRFAAWHEDVAAERVADGSLI